MEIVLRLSANAIAESNCFLTTQVGEKFGNLVGLISHGKIVFAVG